MMITMDTETQGLNATKFILGTICMPDGKKEVFLERKRMADRIIEIIEKNAIKSEKTDIYAHNMKYDFYAVFRDRWSMFSYISYPSPFIAVLKTRNLGERSMGTFHDSMDIYPMSLEKLGENIGMAKMKMPEYGEQWKLVEYCKRDSEIVMAALLKTRGDIKRMFNVRPKRLFTAGQIAMSTYVSWAKKNTSEYGERTYWEMLAEYEKPKEAGKKGTWKIAGTKEPEMARKAYRGAMNLAFQTGKHTKATMIDINSLYGWVMAKMRFPEIKDEIIMKPGEAGKGYIENVGMTEATVQIGKLTGNGGLLPIKYDGILMFPTKEGLKMKSVWTNEELWKAQENGYKILEVGKQVMYPDMATNPFREFIGKLYEMKKKPETKQAAKMMMVALSGKFGQKGVRKKIEFIHRQDAYDYCKNGWEVIGEAGEMYGIAKTEEGAEPYFVNPVIIALITAGARIRLWEDMQKIAARDLLYCDTDSIIMKNFQRYEGDFEVNNEMGKWKIEFENNNIDIKGEKRYACGGLIKVSGIHKPTEKGWEAGTEKQRRMIGLTEELQGRGKAGEFTEEMIGISQAAKKDVKIKGREVVDL